MVDEYGDLMGLVTLEDILEEIVGDITDEHDIVVEGVRPQLDGSVNVDGSVPIRDLNRAMDWHLPDDEATTIAGLVIHEARSIPEPGQSFTFHGFRFRVLRRQRNRITVAAHHAARQAAGGAGGVSLLARRLGRLRFPAPRQTEPLDLCGEKQFVRSIGLFPIVHGHVDTCPAEMQLAMP